MYLFSEAIKETRSIYRKEKQVKGKYWRDNGSLRLIILILLFSEYHTVLVQNWTILSTQGLKEVGTESFFSESQEHKGHKENTKNTKFYTLSSMASLLSIKINFQNKLQTNECWNLPRSQFLFLIFFRVFPCLRGYWFSTKSFF